MRFSHFLVLGAALASAAAIAGGKSAEMVRQAQAKLSAQGQYSGRVDGVLDAKTQAALRAFQRSRGLKASGQLDSPTVAALGIGAPGSAAAGASGERRAPRP